METRRISIDQISDQKYDGYIWMSDKEDPDLLKGKKFSLPEGCNPFIVEGQLYSEEAGLSYSIKYVDGEYIVFEHKVSAADISSPDNEVIVYEPNRMNVGGLKFLRVWEKKADDNCLDMDVLTLTKNVFIGFKKKEGK